LSQPASFTINASEAEEALDMLVSGAGKVGRKLLKCPSTSTPSSWHLSLPPHFNTALGLKFSQRQKVKNAKVVKRWKEWAQSGNFCFNEGSIVYDRDVYGLKKWGEKLEAINTFIVIGKTVPVSLRIIKDEETGLKETRRDPGFVSFKIYGLDHESRLKSIFIRETSSTQDDFVRFAISGKLPT
jgi:hypothetical protein